MPTKIEWCDETFNPWWGCERVSPGCAHCYAATFSRRLGMDHLWPRRPSVQNGQEHGFRFFGDEHWREPLRWARTLPAKLGRRPRIFCASMADVFEDRPEIEEPRARLFELIRETPELDWLVLTKRVDVAFQFCGWPSFGKVYPNVWLGVSIENARHNYRANVLRQIPATVRFISAEPLLGSLVAHPARPLDLTEIDWLIIGGESGPGARPFHLEHARELVRARAGRVWRNPPALFVKQLGSRPVGGIMDGPLVLADAKGGDPEEWPPDLRIREWPSISSQLVRSVA